MAKTVRLTVDMMPRWQLVVEEGAGETIGRTVDLAMGKHRIGRAVEAEYRFECTTVSRFHLSISVEPDKVEVQDLGSANGTSVNGRDVVKAELRAGDRIVLGKQLRLGLKRQGETLPPVPQQSSPDSSPGQGAGSQEDDSLPSLPNIQAPELHFRASRSMYNDQVVVVLIEGRVDAYTYPELNEKLEQAITSGERFLVLDLSALRFIDHTGLGVIVKIATSLDRYGGQLRLIGLKDQRLIDTFKLSRLDSFFSGRIAASEERAVADMARYLRGR